MIEITNLTMNFGGVRALDNLTVELDDSVVGIIGPNGAGKTTLLNVLSGFMIPTTGTAHPHCAQAGRLCLCAGSRPDPLCWDACRAGAKA